MLLAQMQSGKTGTYLYIACEMMRQNRCKHVIIMTGCREKLLKRQCECDLEKFRKAYCRDHAEKLTGPEACDLQERLNQIKVVWGTDLRKTPLNEHTLVIWEESHFAQSQDNEPYKWFVKHDIYKPLYGDFSSIVDRKIKILSVSGGKLLYSSTLTILCLAWFVFSQTMLFNKLKYLSKII